VRLCSDLPASLQALPNESPGTTPTRHPPVFNGLARPGKAADRHAFWVFGRSRRDDLSGEPRGTASGALDMRIAGDAGGGSALRSRE